MKDYKIWTIIIVVVILLLGVQQYIIWTNEPKEDLLMKKINQIELKLDSLNSKKDSIRIIIDSTNVKIINNEHHYKETITNILSNSDSINDAWTKQYIDNYRKRFLIR